MLQITRERSLIIFVILLLVVILIITWIGQVRLNELTGKNQSLIQENINLQLANTRLTEKLATLEKEGTKDDSVLMEGLLEKSLKQKGLTVAQLKADLLKRSDLIKPKAVLGGTMFFTESEIKVLTDKWIIAEFEDGHIYGYALLKYEVKSGKLNWTVLDSYVFE